MVVTGHIIHAGKLKSEIWVAEKGVLPISFLSYLEWSGVS